jgi:hypothetical protein
MKYDRVAIVASPAYRALTSEDAEVFGYKFSSKKNREYLHTLMLHLLQDWTQRTATVWGLTHRWLRISSPADCVPWDS